LIVIVQEALPDKSTPATVMVGNPEVAVRESAAPVVLLQVPPNVAGLATTTSPGSVSVNPISLVGVDLLTIVKVSNPFWFTPTGFGALNLVSTGEPGEVTVNVEEAVLPIPLLAELTSPVVLTFAPVAVLVTST